MTTGQLSAPPPDDGRYPSLLRHAGAVVPVMAKSPQHPADVLSSYLQKKHRLHSDEKRVISALAFHALRMLPLAEHCAVAACRNVDWSVCRNIPNKRDAFSVKFLTPETGAAATAAAALLAESAFPGALDAKDLPLDMLYAIEGFLELHTTCPNPEYWCHAVIEAFETLRRDAVGSIASSDGGDMETLALYTSVQPWILQSWIRQRGIRYAADLALSLYRPSLVNLRVNLRADTRSAVAEELAGAGMPVQFGNLSPAALILEERARVTGADAYARGAFEVQDEGSQIIGYAIAPEEGHMVLDACAGAGGKTLHIAELLANTGNVIAADPEYRRLKQVLPRAARANFDCIETVPTRILEEDFTAHLNRYDRVLIDAPCSSLGTARRYPIPKWRLEEKSLRKIVRTQQRLIERYAPTVRPGGFLVYATCSLLPQENAEIVKNFLDAHTEFRPAPLNEDLARNGVRIPRLEDGAWTAQLTPLEHGTDGFFMARMQKYI